jgi:hypothetical protein
MAMTKRSECSPGSHPHADRPNWQAAETIEDYVRNVREGLEKWSDRKAAKLFGVSRTKLWRWSMLAEIPEDLFERLVTVPMASTKALAQVGPYFRGGVNNVAEVERCPCCGHVLRVRARVSKRFAPIVLDWIREQDRERPS